MAPFNHILKLVFFLWLLLGVVVCFISLNYGVSLNDEALYSAWPYRFTLGDRPFLDEIYPSQWTALFTTPLIRLFTIMNGDTSGIILFHRRAYFFFALVSASFLIWIIRGKVQTVFSFCLGAILVFFLPWRISAFSYNTLPMLLFTLALFLHLAPIQIKKWSKVLSGILFSACILSNPAYVFPVSLAFTLSIFWYPHQTVKLIPYYFTGCLLVLLLLPSLRYLLEARDFWSAFLMESKGGIGYFETLYSFLRSQPGKGWFLAVFVTSYFLLRKVEVVAFPLVILCPLIFSFCLRGSDPQLFFNSFGLFAPFYYFCLPERDFFDKVLMRIVWPTALVAAGTISWSSTNRFYNASFGFLPGVLVSLFFLCRASELWCRSHKIKWPGLLATFVFLVIHFLLINIRQKPYSDAALAQLTHQVNSGPFKGLYTTSQKRSLLLEIQGLIEATKKFQERILFYDHFPAGYLMTNLKPLARSTWDINGPEELRSALEHFRVKSFISVRVFYPMNKAWTRVNLKEQSPLDRFIEDFDCRFTRKDHFFVSDCLRK